MKKWIKVRLKKRRMWLLRLLHLRQTRRINRWLRDVEAAIIQEMVKPDFKKKINKMIVDGLCYGTSPLEGALKDIELMEEVKKIDREIAQTFIEADDQIHRGIIEPGPEKFTGLENRIKKIEEGEDG